MGWKDAPIVDSGTPAWQSAPPVDSPSVKAIPQKTQEDFLREAAQEMPWLERQGASMGLQLMKGYQGVKELLGGTADKTVVKAADVAAQEAPTGAFVGEVARFAPAALAGSAVLPAMGAAAAIGALTTPGDITARAKAAAMEGGFAGLGTLVGKGATKVLQSGSLDRAKDVLRRIMGQQSDDLLVGAAQTGLRPSQVLAGTDAGANVAALERIMRSPQGINAAKDPLEAASFWRGADEVGEVGRLSQLQQAAGGASSESAALRRKFISEQLEAEYGPVKAKILSDLANTNKTYEELISALGQKEASYVQALRESGQLRTAAGQAISPVTGRAGLVPADNVGLNVGQRLPTAQRGVGEIPKEINEQAYQQLSGAASQIDDLARVHRGDADLIRQRLSELSPAFTTGQLDDYLARQTAGAVPGTQAHSVLTRLQKALAWAKDDPQRLADLRKTGVNDLIGDLVGAEGLASKEAGAALTSFKKQLDTTLGERFIKDYLEPYSKGLAERSSLELMDKLRYMYENSPEQFMRAVKGDMPELLKGTQFKTIQEALGDSRFTTIKQVAATKTRDESITKASQETDAAVAEILRRKGFSKLLPNMLNRYITLANSAIKSGEMKVNEAMYRHLEKAMRDPDSFRELLNMLPPEQRSVMRKLVIESYRTGAVGVAGAATAGVAE